MMKNILLPALFLLLTVMPCRSQTWCAPGAVWQYTVHNGAFPFSGERGIHQLAFSHTLIANGKICDHLKGITQGTLNMMPWANTNYSGVDIYQENGVVFFRPEFGSGFDTLANLNANPGQGWYCRANDTTLGKLVVTDTSHVNISGQSRRKLVFDSIPSKSFIEGIGFTYDFFYPYVWNHPNATDTWPRKGSFKCYSDNTIGVFKTDQNWACIDVTTGIQSHAPEENFRLHPNPSTGPVRVETEFEGFILMADVLGRELLRRQVNVGLTELDFSNYGPGTYYLNFYTPGRVIRSKLVICNSR